MRLNNRKFDEMRKIEVEIDVNLYAEGSCIIKFGNTKVLCTASIDESVPPFLKGKNSGWVTAEYSLLPRSTHSRVKRDISSGKLSGRTQEIQRLISRSLRASVDLKMLGERQIIIDCDVMQADGGTRTAAITGGYIALNLACKKLLTKNLIKQMPIINQLAAVSCGIVKGVPVLDLDYIEDKDAEVDANFILASNNQIIEIQSTAERAVFSRNQLLEMMDLAEKGIADLIKIQNTYLS